MTKQNSNDVNSTLSRRQLLSSAAIGGLAVAGASVLSPVSAGAKVLSNQANEYWTRARTDRYLCSQIHYGKSLELSRVVDSPNLDEAEKSLALRTAHCPSCGVHIHPGAEAAGYSIGV